MLELFRIDGGQRELVSSVFSILASVTESSPGTPLA